ncbi:MAG: hypothetical protein F4Y61_05595 [Rhodothermaceae bacterium]|nr:hypothetical protein [Rhodothermaceae bacterium]
MRPKLLSGVNQLLDHATGSSRSRLSLFVFILVVMATPYWFAGQFESVGMPIVASGAAGLAAAVLAGGAAGLAAATLDKIASRWLDRRWHG